MNTGTPRWLSLRRRFPQKPLPSAATSGSSPRQAAGLGLLSHSLPKPGDRVPSRICLHSGTSCWGLLEVQSQRASRAAVPQSLEASPATRSSPCIPEGTLTGADDYWALRCRPAARSLPGGLSLGVPYASGLRLSFFIHLAVRQKPQRKLAARSGLWAASAAAGRAQSPELRTPSTWLRPRRPGSPRGLWLPRSLYRSILPAHAAPGASRTPERVRRTSRYSPESLPGWRPPRLLLGADPSELLVLAPGL